MMDLLDIKPVDSVSNQTCISKDRALPQVEARCFTIGGKFHAGLYDGMRVTFSKISLYCRMVDAILV